MEGAEEHKSLQGNIWERIWKQIKDINVVLQVVTIFLEKRKAGVKEKVTRPFYFSQFFYARPANKVTFEHRTQGRKGGRSLLCGQVCAQQRE